VQAPSASEPAKEDIAKNENACRLPEIDQMQAKRSQHHPIPQAHLSQSQTL
jgi:hypothetical protein